MTEQNCKVVKKVAPPSPQFLHQPPFHVYPPFLAKKYYPTQFLEGPTPPLPFLNQIFHVTAPIIKSLTEVLYV